jgi:hypothetical protein
LTAGFVFHPLSPGPSGAESTFAIHFARPRLACPLHQEADEEQCDAGETHPKPLAIFGSNASNDTKCNPFINILEPDFFLNISSPSFLFSSL